jgi:hypothetical protein
VVVQVMVMLETQMVHNHLLLLLQEDPEVETLVVEQAGQELWVKEIMAD